MVFEHGAADLVGVARVALLRHVDIGRHGRSAHAQAHDQAGVAINSKFNSTCPYYVIEGDLIM